MYDYGLFLKYVRTRKTLNVQEWGTPSTQGDQAKKYEVHFQQASRITIIRSNEIDAERHSGAVGSIATLQL